MGKLLHAEWYKLLHDRAFWVALAAAFLLDLLVFSGSSILSRTGSQVLPETMKKAIGTVLIVCLYSGLFIGDDFAGRTFYHGLMTGKSRNTVCMAKAVVFEAASEMILFLFPLFLTVFCTARNGWGKAASAGPPPQLILVVLSLLILGLAVASAPLLVAVCFRDVGRTVGISLLLCFVMIVLLNSAASPVFFRIFPVGILILVADGTVSPAYGMGFGIFWAGLLTAAALWVFRRAELR